jgi:Uma2 family endonuclease
MAIFWLVALSSLANFCESFSPVFGHESRVLTFSVKKQRTAAQAWAPTVPKGINLSQGALATEYGVHKSTFESFFARLEQSSYLGYKWELINNTVFIYERVESLHELATGAFDSAFRDLASEGGWKSDIHSTRSMELINPDQPQDSNWQPDSSFLPKNRRSPVGSHDKLHPYPTLIVEIAVSETNDHVISQAHKYLGPNTAVEIVLVLLIRPKDPTAVDRLKVLKFERGRRNPCWECSFADPACMSPGDPAFRLKLPVKLLFDSAARMPPALIGRSNVELDLFRWKQEYFKY